jgi:hypothetical protein
MTQFTSFVAVEEMIVTDGGQPRRIDVPVEVPEGVNRAAVEGSRPAGNLMGLSAYSLSNLSPGAADITRSGTNVGGNFGRGDAKRRVNAPPPNAPPSATVTVVAEDEAVTGRLLTPEERQSAKLRAKLHPALVTVVERLKKKIPIPSAEEITFVREGKAEIQIWLTDKSPENLAKLKEIGFEVILDPKTSKLVIGRLPIEKIEALSALDFVRFAAPQTNK